MFSLLVGLESTNRTYPWIGVPEGHHGVSHHRYDPDLVAKKAKIDTYHVQLFRDFLEKLHAVPEGDGTLLDPSMILFGGGLGDGNAHDHMNLPTLVGGGVAALKGGRHVRAPTTRPWRTSCSPSSTRRESPCRRGSATARSTLPSADGRSP